MKKLVILMVVLAYLGWIAVMVNSQVQLLNKPVTKSGTVDIQRAILSGGLVPDGLTVIQASPGALKVEINKGMQPYGQPEFEDSPRGSDVQPTQHPQPTSHVTETDTFHPQVTYGHVNE